MRESLSELLQRTQARPMLPGISGHVTATLRDIATGRVKQQVSQNNLILASYFQFLYFGDQSLTPLYIVISNDAEDPNYYAHMSFSTFQDTESASCTRSLDYANKIYTYSYSFVGVTAPGRTVSWVGLANELVNTYNTYCKAHYPIFACVKLNSSVYQTPTDSLEIVYRLNFVRI